MKKLLVLSILLIGCSANPNKSPYSEEETIERRERYARKAEQDTMARAATERLKMSGLPMMELCDNHRYANKVNNKYFNEIRRRAGFTVDELQLISKKEINYNMSEVALTCSFGQPISKETLLLPLNFIRYTYRKGYVDIKNDAVVAIKPIN
jgi:hypothetical protein